MDADAAKTVTGRDCSGMKNYVYIVECKDGTFYTGWTTNLQQRVEAHNQGKGAKYTKGRGPVKLVYWEEFPTKKEALSREYAIKQLGRREKERLIYYSPS